MQSDPPPKPKKKTLAQLRAEAIASAGTLKPLLKRRPKKPLPAEIDPTIKAKRAAKVQEERLKSEASQLRRKLKKVETKLTAQAVVAPIVQDQDGGALVTPEILSELTPSARAMVERQDVIFQPNPGPQTDFLAASEREVFYGGARGGGKSYAMLVDPLRYCGNKNHRALLLRRTMPELRDMIAKSQMLYPKAFKGARWREQEKEWRFPSGARIEFGYAENLQDALRYQGQSYSWIGFDELPQFPTPEVWNFLRSSLRSVDPELPAFMRATGNPGNVGSAWVKDMFIDPAPSNTRFEVPVQVQLPGGRVLNESISRRYIPSTVFDNPYLVYDSSYVTMLASLPEMQRRQFLEGDWNAFDGSAFSEFREDVHVVEPFDIPPGWMRFRAADWGFSSPACCLWVACDEDGDLWVYRELYTKKQTADVFARRVLDLEQGEPIRYGVLDASCWATRGDVGPSIAETMIREGCRWRMSDRSPRSRKMGKLELHRRLGINPETERPRLRIFKSCRNLIRTLPMLPLDPNDQEDVDTDAEDHAYDALRYAVMSRPLNVEGPFAAEDRYRSQAYTPADPVFGY